MKQKTTIFAIILSMVFLIAINSDAQTSGKLKKQTYSAYLSNSVTVWKVIEKQISTKQNQSPDNMQLLLDLTNVQYGLLNACIANKDKDTYNQYIEKAEKNVEELIESDDQWAEAHALKSALLSVEMSFSPSKGMYLGAKSAQHIESAIKADPSEPTGWVQKGGSKLFTPKMFGGSIGEAIKCYKEAIRLYETDTMQTSNNWQYINTLAWLGNAYKQNENYEMAKQTYRKAIAVEPEFYWVKNILMLDLEKEMKNE